MQTGKGAGLFVLAAVVLARCAMADLAVGGTDDPRRLAKLGRARHPAQRHKGAQQQRGQQNMAGNEFHRRFVRPASIASKKTG